MKRRPFLIFVTGIRAVPNREVLTSTYDFPAGALSIATYLNHQRWPTAVVPLDMFLEWSHDADAIDRKLAAVVRDAIAAYKPRVVGVTAPYTMLYPAAARVIELVKQADPSISAGMGGPHVTYAAASSLRESPLVDWIVRGEGEYAAKALLETIEAGGDLSKVPALTWRRADGVIVDNPAGPPVDLDTLPHLDYRLLPRTYVQSMTVNIMASRGCAYKCTYCTETNFWGKSVRYRPIHDVVHEIRTLTEEYDNPPIGFEDSMFDMRTPYFMELMKEIEPLDLYPGFYMLSRIDTVCQEGIEALQRAGMNNVLFGIESMSPRVLKKMAKRITPQQTVDTLEMCARNRMIVGSFWLFGHPGDTPEEAAVTLDGLDMLYRRGLNHTAELAMFVPYPGTVYFDQPDRFGVRILHRDWSRWGRINTDPCCELTDFPKEGIYDAWTRGVQVVRKWQVERPVTEPVAATFTTDSRPPGYPAYPGRA